MDLVTGHAGTEHVSAADVAELVRGLFGDTDCVLNVGDKLACTVLDANTVQIGTGSLLMQGHHARIDIAEQVAIESGTVGYNRNDLVVARYTLGDGNVQAMVLAVRKGELTAGTPVDPEIVEGDIDGGDLTAEVALWRIPIEGVNVGDPQRVLPILQPFLSRATGIEGKMGTVPAGKTLQGEISTLQDSVVRVNTDENVSLATIGSSGVDLIKIRMLKDGVGDYLIDAGEYGIELYKRGVGTVWKMLSAPQETSTGFVMNASNLDSITLQRYKAMNGIVSIDVRVKTKVAYTADSRLELGTIPSAYRPTSLAYAPTNQEGGVVIITTSGSVAFYGTRSMSAGTDIEFIVTFIK